MYIIERDGPKKITCLARDGEGVEEDGGGEEEELQGHLFWVFGFCVCMHGEQVSKQTDG